ncbi:MAG: DUF1307 domain-containing protein [Bacilli bacterium]|nr:DUF1307 domain-containing protein [Bacilli bacterium]
MKKYLSIITILSLCILLTGCKGKLVVNKCHGESNQTASGYKLVTDYKISSRKNIVEKIELKQTIESDSKEKLDNFKTNLEKQYKDNNSRYGGYSYNIKDEENKIVIELTIDYSKMDLNKFVTDNVAMKNYVNDKNQLTLDGAKKMYEASGNKCE